MQYLLSIGLDIHVHVHFQCMQCAPGPDCVCLLSSYPRALLLLLIIVNVPTVNEIKIYQY